MEEKSVKEYQTPRVEILEMIFEGSVRVESGGIAGGDAGGESGWD